MPPVLDKLSAELAARLGDPLEASGARISAANIKDGRVYTIEDRDWYLTQAMRLFVTMLGPRFLDDEGFQENYILIERNVDATVDHDFPQEATAVIHVDYYGRKALHASMDILKRRHHTHWQHVPMWRVTTGPKILFYNMMTDAVVDIYYAKFIPDLTHAGSVDIELSPNLYGYVLDIAEAIGRRNHQEYGLAGVAWQRAAGNLKDMKENSSGRSQS